MAVREADADLEAMVYSTMNSDHIEMIQLIAQLRDGAALGWDRHRLLDIISRLISFSQEHFRREEKLMNKFHYPATDEHKRQHAMLIRQAEAYLYNMSNGCQGEPRDIATYFHRWITDHIRTFDRELERFLSTPMRLAIPA